MPDPTEFARWLAAVVIQAGGDVTLTNDELNHLMDLNLSIAEDADGNATGLRIRATTEES